jgi:hypothetical protein
MLADLAIVSSSPTRPIALRQYGRTACQPHGSLRYFSSRSRISLNWTVMGGPT